MDFEKGLHSSFTSVFLDSAIAGCLFHLGQSCWRKICELGQRVKYNTNADFAIKIKCFTALAFVPPEHVVTSFEELSDDEEVPAEFVAYFESTYIGILRGRGANQRRDRPSFPVEMWNVRARTLDDMPRTNNAAEGFHSALRASITSHHPNLWKFLSAIAAEEALIQTKINHYRRGDTIIKREKYKVINQRLKTLSQQFENDNCLQFLRNIAINLH